MLLTFQLNILERFLFFHDWQHFILNGFIIAVDFQITVKGQNGAVGTELTAIGYDLYIDHIAFAWRHQGCQRSGINQLVQLILIICQIFLDSCRRIQNTRRTNGLMRILCIFTVFLTGTSLVVLPVGFFDIAFRVLDKLITQSCGIGTHIGNKTLADSSRKRKSLIQLLCNLHGFLCSKAQLGACLLLQGGGDERHSRFFLTNLLFNAADNEVMTAALDDRIDLLLRFQVSLLAVNLV